MGFEGRDFYEKGFSCWHNGRYYHYTSSCYEPGSDGKLALSVKRPFVEGVTRGSTSSALLCLERITEEGKNLGKLKMTCVNQIDVFANVPSLILDPALKKQSNSWVASLSKYYAKNYKKL